MRSLKIQSDLELNTSSRLLQAGVKVFGNYGFLGASVRQIAEDAGTNIAAIKYHYSSKDALWRAVVGHLYRKLGEAILEDEADWPKMTPRQRVINSTSKFIRFSARHPELHRIVLFETTSQGERLDWLIKTHMREFTERSLAWVALAQESGVYAKNISPLSLYFILSGAAQSVFQMAPQIERTFGIDVYDNEEIERHIDAVLTVILKDEKT